MSDYISHPLQSSWVRFLMDLATCTSPWEPPRDIQICVFTLPQHKSISNLKNLHEITRSVPLRLLPNQLLYGKLYFWHVLTEDGLPPQVYIHLAYWILFPTFSEDTLNLCILSYVTHWYPCRSFAQLQLSRHFINFSPGSDHLVTSCNLLLLQTIKFHSG